MPQEDANKEDVLRERHAIAEGNSADSQQNTLPDWASLIIEGIEEVLFSVDREWRFTYLNHQASVVLGQPSEALLGKIMWEAFPSLIGSNFEGLYRQAMADGAPGRLEDFSQTRQAWYDVRAYPIPQGLLVYFQDITSRKLAEAEIQRHAERARVQAEVSRTLAEATHDYQATLDTAARQLAEIVGDACIIRLIADDGQWFEFAASYHPDPEAAAFVRDVLVGTHHQRVTEGLAGRAVQTGQPVLIPVISSEQIKATTPLKYLPYLERFTVSSVLIAPLRAIGQVIGIVAMTRNAPGRPYTDADQTLLQDLSDRVAIAITNARLFQQIQSELDERTRVEAALQSSEERFRALIEHTPDAIALFHLDGTIVYGSPATTRILGYPLDEFIGRNGFDLIHPDDRTDIAAQLTKTLDDPSISVPVHVRIRHHDGSWRVLEGMFTNLLDNPSVGAIINNYRDITERVRTEEALRVSEARFTGIVSSAMDAIISIDESMRIVVFNVAAEQMFHCTAAAVIGQPLDQFLPASAQHLHTQYIRGFGQTGITSRSMRSPGTLTAIRVTGEEFPIEATISQTLAAGQRLYTVIIRDITERKQAEVALRKTQAQLLQSQKMESMGQLAGGIAHDFNNLLTVIIGYCDFMLTGLRETDLWYPDVLEIQKAGNRAAALVRQILAFSRKQVLEPKVVNLNETVANLETLLHRVLGADIAVVSVLDPHLAPVLVDPGQIEQVIVNLIVNARDAMPDGGQLTIETSNVELDEHYRSSEHPTVKTGKYVMLAVSDTGIGMDRATQEQIFEPFFTTKELGKGTGLGLATVYGIVSQSEGYIWAYSELGVGTTLKVYIPIIADRAVVSSQGMTRAEPHVLPHAASMMRAGRGRTILVVEDDTFVRDFIHRVLSQVGYTILEAHNGYEALSVIATVADQIDIVLTDMVMPEMGGRALVDRLKEQWADLKVMCMSGYTDHAVQRHSTLRPCDTFLQKPFTSTTLLYRIDELLNDVGDD